MVSAVPGIEKLANIKAEDLECGFARHVFEIATKAGR